MDPEAQAGDIDLSTVKSRSVSGIITLISRTFVIRIIGLVGISLLTFYLSPKDFGTFAAVNNLIFILSFFSDIGLAASLVQKKTQLSSTDLKTTFTVQQVLVTSSCLLMLLVSPFLSKSFSIGPDGMWVFYSLLAAFFLASLKTIPSVILERNLMFGKLAAVEVVESLLYWGIAIALAWQGFGLTSYAWAVLVRGLVGTAYIYYLAPWNIGFSYSTSSLKSLLTFGVPYQLNSFIALAKDRFVDLVVWKIIGSEGVGIISWARNYSEQPLRLVMDNVTKVTFPAFSRLQDNPRDLKTYLEKSLFFISITTFPFLIGLCLLAPQIVDLVPRYSKWQIALLPLTLYSVNTAWASIATPLSNTLNALGKVRMNTWLMLMWLGLAWILTPLLASRYGFIGVAVSSSIISFFSIIPILIVRHITGFSIRASILVPAAVSVVMGVVTYLLKVTLPLSWTGLTLNILTSGCIFAGLIYIFCKKTLVPDIKKIVATYANK